MVAKIRHLYQDATLFFRIQFIGWPRTLNDCPKSQDNLAPIATVEYIYCFLICSIYIPPFLQKLKVAHMEIIIIPLTIIPIILSKSYWIWEFVQAMPPFLFQYYLLYHRDIQISLINEYELIRNAGVQDSHSSATIYCGWDQSRLSASGHRYIYIWGTREVNGYKRCFMTIVISFMT